MRQMIRRLWARSPDKRPGSPTAALELAGPLPSYLLYSPELGLEDWRGARASDADVAVERRSRLRTSVLRFLGRAG